ncbi:hypothetical protein WA026_002800 [Henosepilachna vigintioctopunctata]|uniref:Peptidase S1 domain-containing protein n=1 Tax=Henosepilachna vigintioctopunctata TaxID=420089 RepID=A0AAW1TUI8_9CUCU
MKRHSVVIFLLFGVVFSQNNPRIPPNPCPSIFNYYYDSDNNIFGEILVPNDGSKIFRMEVNTSYVGLFDQNTRPRLKLDLVTQSDYLLQSKQLTYKLTFSRHDRVPRITQIKFNGRIYCSGPSEMLTSAGVSELWVFKETRLQTFTYYPDQPAVTRPMTTNKPTMPPFIPPRPTTPHYPSYPNDYWTNAPVYPGSGSAGSGNNGAPLPIIDNTQNDPQCGISDRTMNLIVDGVTTVQNEFPWLVALYKWYGLNYEFLCTASLVDRYHVVTAAHCLRFFNSNLVKKEDLILIFGRSHLKHWAEKTENVLRSVTNVEVNPDYKQYSGHGDLAILTLNKPVEYSRTIKPICLWNDYDDLRYVVGKYGTVVGWGKDEGQQDYLVDPKKIEMPIVSEEVCLRSNYEFRNLTSEKTFCAGERNGKGPCTGDSGSPFMLQKNGRWTLRGIVSQAIIDRSTSRCNLRDYIVFTDLAKYTRWIRSRL